MKQSSVYRLLEKIYFVFTFECSGRACKFLIRRNEFSGIFNVRAIPMSDRNAFANKMYRDGRFPFKLVRICSRTARCSRRFQFLRFISPRENRITYGDDLIKQNASRRQWQLREPQRERGVSVFINSRLWEVGRRGRSNSRWHRPLPFFGRDWSPFKRGRGLNS